MAPDPQPIAKAPGDGLLLLGALLRKRRIELGYTHRPAFIRDRLPLTPKGNLNTRLVADIEKAYRKDFPDYTLEKLAAAYEVTYESVVAVAYLRARALEPGPPRGPVALLVPAGPPGWMASDKRRAAANRLYVDRIRERLNLLRAQGIPSPSGAQLFPDSPADARDWDKYDDWEPRDRVWFLADLQRLTKGGREGNSGTGALRRSNIAGQWLTWISHTSDVTLAHPRALRV